ncbi:MAG TPA: DUF892 family protein [Armatimonadota bacterium]|nr:DUF892 family protein [Armatimonadota bacterium]
MAMEMHDYLLLRCSQMLAAERDIEKMNTTLAQEVQNPRLKEALKRHAAPTQQQIQNLEQVVQKLGGGSEHTGGFVGQIEERLGMRTDQQNPETQTMMKMHQQFIDMNPPQQLIDVNDAIRRG